MQAPTDPKAPSIRRRRRKDARPAEIIAAAMGLWAERGFSATRLEDVAVRAGIAKGTIYRYFESKERLFEAALRERLLSMMQTTDGLLTTYVGDTRELLTQFFRAVRTRLADEGAIVLPRILIGEGHRFPELVALYRDIALTRGLATARAILKRGVLRGELQSDAEMTDPRILMAPMILGALTAPLLSGDLPPVDDAFIDQHVGMLMRALSIRTGD